MRWISALALAATLFAAHAATAAATSPPGRSEPPAVVQAVVNLSEIARREEGKVVPLPPCREVDRPQPIPHEFPLPPGVPVMGRRAGAKDGTEAPRATTASPPLLESFAALGDNGTAIPPDTHGAAGPDHLITALNTQVRVQDRSGLTVSTASLGGFFAAVSPGGPFDPKVVYDPYDDRFVIAACGAGPSPSSSLLVGVSQTSDPTGNWNLYKFDADPADLVWADYPSLGFNKQWVVINVNIFTITGGNAVRGDIHVIDKAELYAGAGSPLRQVLSDATAFTLCPAITYDDTLAEEYLVQSLNAGAGAIRLSRITGAFPGPLSLAVVSSSIGPPWAFSGPHGFDVRPLDFAPQLGSTEKIQTNDDRIQNVVYRNGRVWVAHTVFLPAGANPTRSSIQWWELSTAGIVNQRGRIDDATGATFYAFPTIAVNRDDDAVLGFSRFSAAEFAGAVYAYRFAADPPDTFQAEATLKAGEASYFRQGNGENRWGDYSSTMVDPLDDTNFWTIQEYAALPSGGDRWGTWWGKVGPPISCGTLAIDTEPVAARVCFGSQAGFTVAATGTAPLTYRWRRDGTNLNNGGSFAGTRTAALTVNPVFPPQLGSYDVVVRDGCGNTVTSAGAALEFEPFPQASAPDSLTACAGAAAAFAVTASGVPPLLYRWRKDLNNLFDGGRISGADTAALTIDPVSVADAGSYDLRLTDGCGLNVFSAAATLAIEPPPQVSAPAPQSVCPGGTATFQVTATGAAPIAYQWRKDTVPVFDDFHVSGATSPILTINPASAGDQGGFDCVVTDACAATVTSAAAALTVAPAPQVSAPADQVICAGIGATFSVIAGGQGPFTYAWRKDGTPLVDDGRVTGAATATLAIDPAAPGDEGAYDVVVSDGCGSGVTSSAAVLSFGAQPPDPPGNVLRAVKLPGGAGLRWSAVARATSYNLLRCDAAASLPCVPAPYTATPDVFHDDLAAPGDHYWYAIEAVNACGTSG